ncbi:tyrosine protein kinase-like protein [Goatpox virus FZ]|uniref:Tyrosine protein kinase-like protein n=1 Tax=Goatpox virus FZ TaxID=1416740 RepID=A0A075CHN7_9POXV|nr:tyrosine protein kinase-like protein [Goatpox virus FZ]
MDERNSFWSLVKKITTENSQNIINQSYINPIRCIKSDDIYQSYTSVVIKENNQNYIYKGIFNNKEVIVRTFKKSHTSYKILMDISNNEIKNLRRIDSNNILKIYAFYIEMCDGLPRLSLILEYCKRGYLKNVIRKERDLTFKTKLNMAIDCSVGLYNVYKYTNNKPYGCISSVSFLVEENYKVKIICHGLEKILANPPFKNINAIVYQSHKMLSNVFNERTIDDDMYSFGVVLWEIFSGKIPFKNLTTKEIYDLIINKNGQLKLPETPHLIKYTVEKCTSHTSKRPNIKEILYNFSLYKFYN